MGERIHQALQHFVNVARMQNADASDEELLHAFVAQRDQLAFGILLRRHSRLVLAVCHRVLRRTEDVEDAFQATFLIFVRKAGSIKHKNLLANWLYGVAYRSALEVRSQRHRVYERLVPTVPDMAVAATPGHDFEVRAVLDEEINRLPDRYRIPVVLCDLEGKTRKEAAQQMQLPEGTVSGRLTTAHRRLAYRLQRRGIALATAGIAAVLTESSSFAGVLAPTTEALVVKLAAGASGDVPVSVFAIMQGVNRTMLITKLKWWSVLALMCVLAVGSAGLIAANAAKPGDQTVIADEVALNSAPNPKKQPEEKPADVALPKDPKAVVISFDQRLGNAIQAPRPAVLTIYADGKMVHLPMENGNFAGKPKQTEGKLTEKELKDLMRFIVNEQKFFEYDNQATHNELQKAITAAGLNFAAGIDVRAPVTNLKIKTAEKEQEVACPSVWFCATQYPKCVPVVRVHEIQRRLEEIITKMTGKK